MPAACTCSRTSSGRIVGPGISSIRISRGPYQIAARIDPPILRRRLAWPHEDSQRRCPDGYDLTVRPNLRSISIPPGACTATSPEGARFGYAYCRSERVAGKVRMARTHDELEWTP